jgi:hypothetical protein
MVKDEVAGAIREHVITKHFEPARASGVKEFDIA